MPGRVVQTGVTMRCETREPANGRELVISAEVWVEIEQDGERSRHGGQRTLGELVLGEDPTRPLIEIARRQVESNLGTALGDVRIAGADVTRFECYAAPSCIELDDYLQAVLNGTWDEREPRLQPAR